MPGGQKFAPGSQKGSLEIFPYSVSDSKSSSGGTGFPACADRLAGGDARPTDLFMLYGWPKVHE